MKIEIEWSSDEYECDECGTSWASGATVYVDGEELFNEPAIAHCYGGSNLEIEDCFRKILEKLGYELIEK